MLRTRRLSVGNSGPTFDGDLAAPTPQAWRLLYTVPPQTRAILREVQIYFNATQLSGFLIDVFTAGGADVRIINQQVQTEGQYVWTGDTVLEPGDSLNLVSTAVSIGWLISGAELVM